MKHSKSDFIEIYTVNVWQAREGFNVLLAVAKVAPCFWNHRDWRLMHCSRNLTATTVTEGTGLLTVVQPHKQIDVPSVMHV